MESAPAFTRSDRPHCQCPPQTPDPRCLTMHPRAHGPAQPTAAMAGCPWGQCPVGAPLLHTGSGWEVLAALWGLVS